MSRIPAILLSALIALTPVIGALCADGCINADATRLVEVIESCGHGDVSKDSSALRAVACLSAQPDVAVAEARTIGPALAPSGRVMNTARGPVRLPAHERYLHDQPPPVPAGLILRI